MRYLALTLLLSPAFFLVAGCSPAQSTQQGPQQPSGGSIVISPIPFAPPAPTPVPDRPVRPRCQKEWTLHVFEMTGCPACTMLHRSFEDEGVKDQVRKFRLRQYKDDRSVLNLYHIRAYPTMIVYSRTPEGLETEEGRKVGYLSPKDLEAWLRGFNPACEMPD